MEGLKDYVKATKRRKSLEKQDINMHALRILLHLGLISNGVRGQLNMLRRKESNSVNDLLNMGTKSNDSKELSSVRGWVNLH